MYKIKKGSVILHIGYNWPQYLTLLANKFLLWILFFLEAFKLWHGYVQLQENSHSPGIKLQ